MVGDNLDCGVSCFVGDYDWGDFIGWLDFWGGCCFNLYGWVEFD